jgi:chromosome segregation ATPase
VSLKRIEDNESTINTQKLQKFKELSTRESILDQRENAILKKETNIEALKIELESEKSFMSDNNKYDYLKGNMDKLLRETLEHKSSLETANSSRQMMETRISQIDHSNATLRGEISNKERQIRSLDATIDQLQIDQKKSGNPKPPKNSQIGPPRGLLKN